MDFHFLHAADIHLDSPLRGLSAYEGAPVEQFRNATREAFRNLVNHAIETEAAFVVIAGDLYDGDWPDFGTGLFLVRELERLRHKGIRAVILFGNHDAQSRITRSLPWPDTAYQFDHKKPERIPFDDLGVVLHGQSFARMDITANLVDHYPPPVPGRLNIGVLHTALEGNARHAAYAPCTLNQLCNHGYDYWALGHVHSFEVLHREPWVVFPGNVQGRNIRETGAKGCVSVSVTDGRISGVEPVTLDVVRWILAEVSAVGCHSRDQLQARCAEAVRDALAEEADGRPAAVRVRISGETALHGNLFDRLEELENTLIAEAMGSGDCWLESVKVATTPPAARNASAEREAANLLTHLLSDAATDAALRAKLVEVLRPLSDRLPADVVTEGVEDAADAPLVTMLRAGRFEAIVEAVLPDLLALSGEV